MASQIEQLRASFDKMSTVQKKQFIDKLKIQLQNSKSAEHMKFLQECVSKYNMAVRGGSAAVPTSASSPVMAKGKQKKSPLKWIAVCLAIVVVLGGGLFIFSALNNSNTDGGVSIDDKNDNEKIIGTWNTTRDSIGTDAKGNDIPFMTFTFRKDGSYTLLIPQFTIKGGWNEDSIGQEGTYEFKGTTLTLKASYDSAGSANTEQYEIELHRDKMIFVDKTQVYDVYHTIQKDEAFIKD